MITKVLRLVLWVVAVGSIAVGAHWIWTVPQVKWKEVPFASIGTLAAASLAGLVALTVNETIDQRRLREAAEAVRAQEEAVRVRREEAYTSMIEHTVRAFDGTQSSGNEATVRASIAVWGSRQLLGRLSDWHEASYRIMAAHGGVIPPGERAKTQQLVGELAREARADLGLAAADEPTASEVAAMIFNDFAEDGAEA